MGVKFSQEFTTFSHSQTGFALTGLFLASSYIAAQNPCFFSTELPHLNKIKKRICQIHAQNIYLFRQKMHIVGQTSIL